MGFVPVLIRLFIAHFLADFLMQPTKWVGHKEKHRIKSKFLYIHVFVHGLLTYVLIGNWSDVTLPILVMCIHFLIDIIKLYQKQNVKWFLLDQLFHLISILILWILYFDQILTCYYLFFYMLNGPQFWIRVLGYVLILNPTAILISHLTKNWRKEIGNEEEEGLADAGKWIGMLERVLILTFILINQFAFVGFLLAAKSIFRFGDLKGKKSRKLTEYVLIGTLLSFTITIFVGLMMN